MDAEDYTSVDELLALASDREGWLAGQLECQRQIDPVGHNTAASMVTSLLDASAEEWRKGAEIHDGEFTG